ncbi:ABC transporter ATP-binding protein [Pikeienuella sp. HZG-20]|uniref:ABC transporter ATP-binding protein n=1 Tax=Paludibacillus litoralis TaxID=3133267 RepID=UPI0030EE81A8
MRPPPRRFSPRRIERTGDDTPAAGLAGYVLRMTGGWQVAACALSLVATLLALAPIELQRRLFDDAIIAGDNTLMAALGLIYLGVIGFHQVAKFALALLQSWMSESAIYYTRRHLWKLRGDERRVNGEGRDIISVLTTEVEALGGFAGAGPSQALANAAMLVGGLSYMFWVQPTVALMGLLLLAPQVVLAPLMQRRLNRLISVQVRLRRRFVSTLDDETAPGEAEVKARAERLFQLRMVFVWWKMLLKAGLNLLNGAAPIAVIVGGGAMVIAGETSVGIVVAFVGGFSRLADPVRQLISFYREAAEAGVRHQMVAKWMRVS